MYMYKLSIPLLYTKNMDTEANYSYYSLISRRTVGRRSSDGQLIEKRFWLIKSIGEDCF